MSEKTEFSQRLRLAIQEAGYDVRPIVLEREFNTRYWGKPVTLQAVCRWLNGEAIPAQDKLQVLSEWLGVEPQVLRFGGKSISSVQAKKTLWESAISGPEREVIEHYLRLPATERKIVRDVILAFVDAQSFRTDTTPRR